MKVFNTGRHYTVNCQRIGYKEIRGNTLFCDIDRGIHGVIVGRVANQHDVLRHYDNDNYLALGQDNDITYLERWEFEKEIKEAVR